MPQRWQACRCSCVTIVDPLRLLLLHVLLLCCMGHCCCMCYCFACAATLVGVLAAYVVTVTCAVLSVLCLHLSCAAPAATLVALCAVVIACWVALGYTGALGAHMCCDCCCRGCCCHVCSCLVPLLPELLLHRLFACASDVTSMCAHVQVLCGCSCYFWLRACCTFCCLWFRCCCIHCCCCMCYCLCITLEGVS